MVTCEVIRQCRLAWLFIFLLAFALLLWLVIQKIIYLQSNPKNVNLDFNFNATLPFPAVTICNQSPYRYDVHEFDGRLFAIHYSFIFSTLRSCLSQNKWYECFELPHFLRYATLRYDTIRYDGVYLTCSQKLTGSQLSRPHRIKQSKNLAIANRSRVFCAHAETCGRVYTAGLYIKHVKI